MSQEVSKAKRWLMWLITLSVSLIVVCLMERIFWGSWPDTNVDVAWVVGLALVSAMWTMWNHDRGKKS
jgi:hypothetical protein